MVGDHTAHSQQLDLKNRATRERAGTAAGITLDAAHQYAEESSKCSITPCKQPDFVIVDQGPLAMYHENLLQLRVLETISRGKTVFLAP